MDHSYEEIRDVALDLLAGREKGNNGLDQYQALMKAVADVFHRRENSSDNLYSSIPRSMITLSSADRELFLEVFWDLFRQSVITLGLNDSNREFPFFRISTFGKNILEGHEAYFFHDVSTYANVIITEIPNINQITSLYLREAMQAFKAGCILSATVMLGVAAEHTFLLMIEAIEKNTKWAPLFNSVGQQKSLLAKINKFKNVLDQHQRDIPGEIKEDVDTQFAGIIAVIRTFRNQSGHPTGKIISREQAYILLQLFVPYCKKMYQLINFFQSTTP